MKDNFRFYFYSKLILKGKSWNYWRRRRRTRISYRESCSSSTSTHSSKPMMTIYSRYKLMSNKKFFMQSYCSCYVPLPYFFFIQSDLKFVSKLYFNLAIKWNTFDIHASQYIWKRGIRILCFFISYLFVLLCFTLYTEITYPGKYLKYEIFCLRRVRVIQTYLAPWHQLNLHHPQNP